MNRRTTLMSIALLSLVACAFLRRALRKAAHLSGRGSSILRNRSSLLARLPEAKPRPSNRMGRISRTRIKRSTRKVTPRRACFYTFMMANLIRRRVTRFTTPPPICDLMATLSYSAVLRVENSSKSAPSQYLRTASRGQRLPAASLGPTVSRVLPFLSMTNSRSCEFKE